MPTGTRIRDNNVFGSVADNPLTAGSVTLNSSGLVNMSAVIANHSTITLDPLRQYGEPEIVVVTAHTASSSIATIVRGQYGTVPREHPQGTIWVHAPLDEDFIEIRTSITRPSNPYEGQFIFETDTNKLVGYGGTDWAPRDAGGQLGYAQMTATNQTGISALADLTGLSVTVTVGTGRRVKVTGHVGVQQITALATVNELQIRESTTTLSRHFVELDINDFYVHEIAYVTTPTAGSHTYKLSLQTNAGTTNTVYETVNPAFILVEDIGAA